MLLTKSTQELHAKIASIDLTMVPAMSTDRSIPRKTQAALARQLFRQLGIWGISVRSPNYSMAHSVDVRIPMLSDFVVPYNSDGSINPDDPARISNNDTEEKIEAILAVAFPNHINLSDYATDYFDYKWSINH